MIQKKSYLFILSKLKQTKQQRCCCCCGFRWSLIAGRLPGRTDNEIKNYWNTHIRRKLLNRGIDPATHRPLNEAATAATVTTNISFGKQEQQETSSSNGSVVKGSILERCPDLNLELTISPPRQQQPQKNLCFVCSLGLNNSKDCSCNVANGMSL